MKLRYITFWVFLLAFSSLLGCKKFLEEKPRSNLAVPSSLKDFQALLDQSNVMNDLDAASGEASATDCYLTTANFLSRTEWQQRMYTWQTSEVYDRITNEWANLYNVVYRANTVISGIDEVELTTTNAAEWRNVKGQAHFYRGKMFLLGLSIWSKAYHPTTAATELGIPLRLNVNFNETSVRSSQATSYAQVLADLTSAAQLLPNVPVHVMRPSKPAAYALLSRLYLQMGNFEKASLYADSCLAIRSELIDYNTLNVASNFPIAAFGKEVIHSSMVQLLSTINPSTARIDPLLYASYSDNDLRKTVFFLRNSDGTYRFKGSYQGSANLFSGLATDEMYLNRAECKARLGQQELALQDLNLLLRNRYKTGTFVPYTLANTTDVLKLVLEERRKELLMRNLRWADIKRLNILGAGITLERTVNGQTYLLPANSPRFAAPIPEVVIELSGMPQNKYD
ncbi:RagB/SusD family nutrient uptake outer membrane protein [Pedobacter montanisoli]|uniref:RagB/SusD family nutrient uptake outer membrane protein n=1 Tax=Pedobacter montanisoli TaxID=2923277 RepID=A0ABS9ZTC3_9SPHI|nr:RagB/SusD family nutrient uptake outer membrane protein [Pedobacter montanisoli]MCJ0741851.1 RagB/SusD family nutrient uptake outer membrane protein [Pedobacter montanisoli]